MRRIIRVHPDLVCQVMKSQAGKLAKTALEGVTNAIDGDMRNIRMRRAKKRKPAAGHTPFPWGTTESYDDDGVLLGIDIGNIKLDECVAHVASSPDEEGIIDDSVMDDEAKANIRLIRAIPRMLKLIRRVARARTSTELVALTIPAAELIRKLPKPSKS
jgi:hypothetical protein